MLSKILSKHQHDFGGILDFKLDASNAVSIDLTLKNEALNRIDVSSTPSMHTYIFEHIRKNNVKAAIGGYNEERAVYKRSHLFENEGDPRYIHLGIDIWTAPGTKIYQPLHGWVHSVKNNSGFGDYGPTIIMKHVLDGLTFYVLYGHLTLESLEVEEGTEVRKGINFCSIGDAPMNGDWPPHLHIQIISDMVHFKGDYPGVCSNNDRNAFLALCPDPNLILRSPLL